MRAQESVQWTDIDATPAQFALNGGVYVLALVGTFGGSGAVVISQVLPDGSSLAPTHTALAADGITGPLYLPPGSYELTVTDTTAITANVTRVPFD